MIPIGSYHYVTLFGVKVLWETIVFILATFFSLYFLIRQFRKEKMQIDYYDLVLYIIVFSWIGARIWHFAVDYRGPEPLLTALNFWKPGLTSVGFVMGSVFAFYFYSLVYKKKGGPGFLQIVDAGAIYIFAYGFIARLAGCFIDGHKIGTITDVPWAVFRHGALRHPLGLYLGLGHVALFLFMYLVFVKKGKITKKFDGQLLYTALTAYSVLRFFIEFASAEQPRILGLNIVQLTLAVVAVVCSISYYSTPRAYSKKAESSGKKKPQKEKE